MRHARRRGRRASSCVGQNPAVGSANSRCSGCALRQPASGWSCATSSRSSPRRSGTTRPRSRPARSRAEDIGTEVFFLPAAAHTEKDGYVHEHPAPAAVARQGGRPARRLPLGDCGSSTTWAAASARSSPARAERARPRPILDLTWDYPLTGRARRARCGGGAAARSAAARPTARSSPPTRSCATTARRPAARGSTPASTRTASTRPARKRRAHEQNWVAAGVGLGVAGEHAASSTTAPRPTPRASRGRSASATSGGTPRQGRWTGLGDTPTSRPTRRPDYRPERGREGDGRARAATTPFIMQPDGLGWLYAPAGPGRRAAAGALRAARVAGRQPALRAARQPDAPALRPRPTTPTTRRGSDVFPLRAHAPTG